MAPGCTGPPGNAPASYFEQRLARGQAAVIGHPDLDPDVGARGRAGGAEHLLAGHHQLHRMAGLAGQGDRQRLEIDDRLAAEAAADLRWGDAHARFVDAVQPGAERADDVVALGRAPDVGLAVLGNAGDAGMGLDIALVHGLGLERALDDQVGGGEALVDVAERDLDAGGDVRRLVGRVVHAAGAQMVVQDRRVRRHRRDDVRHVRQHLVVHRDQLEGALGDRGAGRGDRGDGVAVIEHLVVGDDVVGEVAEVDRHLAGRDGPRTASRRNRRS